MQVQKIPVSRRKEALSLSIGLRCLLTVGSVREYKSLNRTPGLPFLSPDCRFWRNPWPFPWHLFHRALGPYSPFCCPILQNVFQRRASNGRRRSKSREESLGRIGQNERCPEKTRRPHIVSLHGTMSVININCIELVYASGYYFWSI